MAMIGTIHRLSEFLALLDYVYSGIPAIAPPNYCTYLRMGKELCIEILCGLNFGG